MKEKNICEKCGEDDQTKEYWLFVGYIICVNCYRKYSGAKEN